MSMLLLSVAVLLASGQDPQELVAAVRRHREAHERAIVGEMMELLRIPNVASDRANVRRNAELLQAMLERRGLEARLVVADDSNPAVYGQLDSPGAKRTVLVYAHYDGQPVDPARWSSDPWIPTLRTGPLEEGGETVDLAAHEGSLPGEWRLYARSAADDKAPIVALLAALDALRDAGVAPSVNLRILFEGEEEAGSRNLRAILERHRDLLVADVLLLCDGPVHQTRRPQICYGARGIVGCEMTVYGPDRALHSGHYGNWAPNPGMLLVHLLARMRDAEGRILIEGFAERVRPLSEVGRKALASLPDVDAQLRAAYGVAWSEGGGESLGECLNRPALNVKGMRTGDVGDEARNAIPTEATASLGFRLVPDLDPSIVRELVEQHLVSAGCFVVHDAPTAAQRREHPRIVRLRWGKGYPPYRTALDQPVARALVRVVEEAHGAPIVEVPHLGGSVPMYLFDEVLGLPVILVPIVNHDNRQHGPDENLRLQNLWDGIEWFAAIVACLGQEW